MEDRLREWVREDFGREVGGVTPVHHGADAAADLWRAETAAADAPAATTATAYAIKWSSGGTDAGPITAAHLAQRVHGVPRPVSTLAGTLWSEREGKRLTVTPWLPGDRAAETGLTLAQWTSYGALLADVHQAEIPATLYDVLPRLNPINARMPALTRTIDRRLEAPRDKLETELADTWRVHRDLIFAVLDRLEELQSLDLGGHPVICHADPHLGNVLVAPNQLWLIDWDDVVLAPVEQDLMFMLGGMGSLGPTSEDQLAAFAKGYGPFELDGTRLKYYRCARALEDIALWAGQAIHGPDREDALTILRGVLGPTGLAPLAVS